MKSIYLPECGSHISHACNEACRLAKVRGKNVAFKFNDVFMVASPRRNPRKMQRAWKREIDRAGKIYRRSPESVLQERKRARKIAADNKIAQKLVAELPTVLAQSDLDSLMKWVRELTNHSQWTDVELPHLILTGALLGAGYKRDEHTGQKPDFFDSRDRMGRYIMGQVLDAFHRNMPPHPIISSFVDSYFEL